MERAKGVEPSSLAWEAKVMPLYDARVVADCKGKSFIEIALGDWTVKRKKSQSD
jgi:hypothetical protein